MCEEKTVSNFFAGFGMTDISPLESVPLASYGDDLRRFSEGGFTPLQARSLAITDENGTTMVFVTGDLSWCPGDLGNEIKDRMVAQLGLARDHIVLSGTHTHASVATGHTHVPSVVNYRKRYVEGMIEAAKLALEDRKPAELYVGRVMTEGMNFVRRYIMDDGSLIGDNAYGTGTVIDHHETKADGQLQLAKFVREGGKDIVLSNFQAHPHLEGKTKFFSYQTVGAFRNALEEELGVHSIHWNGAAGNINTHSRIKTENFTKDRELWSRTLCAYARTIYPRMTPVKTGPIRVAEMTHHARVNHMYDDKVEQAKRVQQFFRDGNTAGDTAKFAWQFGINSYYHANRIVANSQQPTHKDIYQFAFSFGDVSGVVLPYEMFDTNGMFIKENTPFEMTFVVGYSHPAYCGYIPAGEAWKNGGYEADNCTFAPGTGEELADNYVALLKQMKEN